MSISVHLLCMFIITSYSYAMAVSGLHEWLKLSRPTRLVHRSGHGQMISLRVHA